MINLSNKVEVKDVKTVYMDEKEVIEINLTNILLVQNRNKTVTKVQIWQEIISQMFNLIILYWHIKIEKL